MARRGAGGGEGAACRPFPIVVVGFMLTLFVTDFLPVVPPYTACFSRAMIRGTVGLKAMSSHFFPRALGEGLGTIFFVKSAA
jgi:hypothetical protein